MTHDTHAAGCACGPIRWLCALTGPFSQPTTVEIHGMRSWTFLVGAGYGPSDLLFPAEFRGRWRVTRTLVDVSYPLGKDKAPAAEAALAERQLATGSGGMSYEARFVETDDPGAFGDRVIPDRAFNAEQRESALRTMALDDLEARWSASNPNVVTMRYKRTGAVIETKVTKRSFDAPAAGAFGTSEYARIADAGSAGIGAAVPYILAQRVQARYRWSDASAPATIEGLEIEQIQGDADA